MFYMARNRAVSPGWAEMGGRLIELALNDVCKNGKYKETAVEFFETGEYLPWCELLGISQAFILSAYRSRLRGGCHQLNLFLDIPDNVG